MIREEHDNRDMQLIGERRSEDPEDEGSERIGDGLAERYRRAGFFVSLRPA